MWGEGVGDILSRACQGVHEIELVDRQTGQVELRRQVEIRRQFEIRRQVEIRR